MYNSSMAKPVIHISEQEAASKFASLMARVRAGEHVIIESGAQPVAILHPAAPRFACCLSLSVSPASTASSATLDTDFAKVVEAAVESHRKPLDPPEWD